MTDARTIVDKLLETGEPDQDYDHGPWDAIVDGLAEAGVPGAHHKEFDKYQGVYLRIPNVGTFWTHAMNDDILVHEQTGKTIEVPYHRMNSTSCWADVEELAKFCNKIISDKIAKESVYNIIDKHLDGPKKPKRK